MKTTRSEQIAPPRRPSRPPPQALVRLVAAFHAHAPLLAASCVALAIAYELVTFSLTFVGRSHSIASGRGATAAVGPAGGVTDLGTLTGLFGVAAAPAAAGTEPRSEALVLTGVVATADPKQGIGLIGPSPSTTRLYVVGAALPGGARLDQVYADHVVIASSRGLESLWLPRGTLAGGAQLAAAPASERSESLASPQRRPEAEEAAIAWFNGFHADPIRDGTRLTGLRLDPMPRYRRDYGVQRGDLLLAIDGMPIVDPDKIPEMLARTAGGAAALLLVRNGTREVVTVAR